MAPSIPLKGSSGAGHAGARIVWESNTLGVGLAAFSQVVQNGIRIMMQYQRAKVQDYMRLNAPWTDRTGNARQGLFARDESTDSVYAIDIYHTVPYGIWLEVANGGKYQIIEPTMTEEGRRIMASMDKLMSGFVKAGVL